VVEGTRRAQQTRVVSKAGVEFRVSTGEQFDGFWSWYASPEWEPETVAVYQRFACPGVTIADIGAWIGPTVLLGAALGAGVVAVEPDPLAAEFLRVNVDLNPELRTRITVVEAAVDATDGTAVLVSNGRGGDSLSHLSSVKGAEGAAWEVRTLSAASFFALPEVAGVAFVKLDAEAAEYTIVPAMVPLTATARPSIYVATHPNLLYDRSTLVTRIRSGLRVVAANRRLVRALSAYRHHYAWAGTFEDRRRRNVLRSLFPLPLRSALLIGGHLFTDQTLV
jgi:FkbM family methyltransferase